MGCSSLLLSFHGIPESHINKLFSEHGENHIADGECCHQCDDEALANCYRGQCFKSSSDVARLMGIPDEKWSVSFQSRLGRAKWIEPYTDARLVELAQKGVKTLLVVCPAFVADCIETLEEIGDRGEAIFKEAGGDSLTLIPCLNDDQNWVSSLATMCARAESLEVQPLTIV